MKYLFAGALALAMAWQPSPARAHEADLTGIPLLADQICDAMIAYDMTGIGPVHEAFEMMILDHLGIDKDGNPNYRLDIRDFWNAHHQEMICVSEAPGYDSPQHVLKRVVDMGGTANFYFGYFLADREVNVNAVEQTPDGPETLVDYLDTILADPDSHLVYDLDEVSRLRSVLIELMDGRRAAELEGE